MVKHYQPGLYKYPQFEDKFRSLLRDAESAAESSKHAPVQIKRFANGHPVSTEASLAALGLSNTIVWCDA